MVNNLTINTLIGAASNYKILSDINLDDLEKITKTYPYFVLGQLLLTKKMQLTHHLFLKQNIKKTAVVVPNRKKVYEFLFQKDILASIQKNTEYTIGNKYTTPIDKKLESENTARAEKKSHKTSEFTAPVDLRQLTKTTKEIDILEQQIIGQTIEYVLAQEIAKTYPEKDQSKAYESTSQESSKKQKFSDWLEILDQTRLKSFRKNEKALSKVDTNKTEVEIIDSFLQKDINSIPTAKDSIEFTPSNLAMLSIVDDENYVTETLANIYAKQGNNQKAIKAYRKLMLKYPKKKAYFAAKIKQLEQGK